MVFSAFFQIFPQLGNVHSIPPRRIYVYTAVNRDFLIWRKGALSDQRLHSLSDFLHE